MCGSVVAMMMIMMMVDDDNDDDDVRGYLLSIIMLCLGVHSYSEPERGCL
jgi:hypothetical protein